MSDSKETEIYFSTQPEKVLLDSLAAHRRFKGITQERVSTSVGSHKNNISRFERNDHSPRLRTLRNYINSIGYDFKIVLVEK
jgi:transcriptional regulator with XRE-family HTH domain